MNTAAYTSTTYAAVLPSYDEARKRWKCPDSRGLPGAFLFDTEAAALDFLRVELAQLRDREAGEAKRAQDARKAAEERAAYLASFRGFLPADPMRAGRILQTLERQFRLRGAVMTRKQIVELLVSEGRTLTADGLQNADGGFLVVGKTERAYAAHLIALRDAVTVSAA